MTEPYIVFQQSQYETYNKDSCQQTKIAQGEYFMHSRTDKEPQRITDPKMVKDAGMIHSVKLGPSTKFVVQRVNGLSVDSKTFNNPYTDRETIINVNMICTNFFVEKYYQNLKKEKMYMTFGAFEAFIVVFLLCLIVVMFDHSSQ